jgi:cytosine/adenosine deaminase-related metal-dependent hydrolase
MPNPINLDANPKYALKGRIVTMDDNATVFEEGYVYIFKDKIINVLPSNADAPDGFNKNEAIDTGGTIYPGMIELHNHMAFNTLPQWIVPKKFNNRAQWARLEVYKQYIRLPVLILGAIEKYAASMTKFAECKCLFSGVTTSQGITLANRGNILKYFKGLVRNVENTGSSALKKANTRIPDVSSRDWVGFKKSLTKSKCLLLHLSEGNIDTARKHFNALQNTETGEWAISDALTGIHANGLSADDLRLMAQMGASVVWSPLSNLMLYGTTLDIKAAKQHGLRLGLGSDWSPSGSKNLLCELKIAKLYSDKEGGVYTDIELARMVTSNPAKMLKWYDKLGSLEADKFADLIIVQGNVDDPYSQLINANEQSITGVLIEGVPRCGSEGFMSGFMGEFETISIGNGVNRVVNAKNVQQNPLPNLELKAAIENLKHGLKNLPEVALGLASGLYNGIFETDDTGQSTQWRILPDEEDFDDSHARHHIGESDGLTLSDLELDPWDFTALADEEYPVIELDDLTVTESDRFFKDLVQQENIPKDIRIGLQKYYNFNIPIPNGGGGQQTEENVLFEKFHYIGNLTDLRNLKGVLSKEQKIVLIDQAANLLSMAYVHSDLKSFLHAANPIPRLSVLKYKLENDIDPRLNEEMVFHKEMITIFNTLRDLHTHYSLPQPFSKLIAFQPFFIEEYFENNTAHYIISRVLPGFEPNALNAGYKVLHWNGVPIRRAIELNAERNAGSNMPAQFARGIDSMTFRPLMRLMPPEEDWVELTYMYENGKENSEKFKWKLAELGSDVSEWFQSIHFGSGFDHLTQSIQQVKKYFIGKDISSDVAGIAKAKIISFKNHQYGYIRIYSFSANRFDFMAEMRRIFSEDLQGVEGVILDARGNGGGDIRTSETALKLFSDKKIEPHRAQFLDNELTRYICNSLSNSNNGVLDFNAWNDSLIKATQTGERYSLAFPITNERELRTIKPVFVGPIVLIVDALCYSATDLFASGFKDHGLGDILGTSANTGAGGANVWTYNQLKVLTTVPEIEQSAFFADLPLDANFRVSVRRILKEKKDRGLLLEDLGVNPDERHFLTKKDLLNGNQDLINHACEMLFKKTGNKKSE